MGFQEDVIVGRRMVNFSFSEVGKYMEIFAFPISMFLLGIALSVLIASAKRKPRRQWRKGPKTQGHPSSVNRPAHLRVVDEPRDWRSESLARVRQSQLFASNPINGEAYRNVFGPLEAHLQKKWNGFRLMAEVPLGSFITVPKRQGNPQTRKDLYRHYGGKRIDFLIIDPFGHPAVAVEYQGTGHQVTDSDEIKRIVLSKAGVALIEHYHDGSTESLITNVGRALGIHRKESGPAKKSRSAEWDETSSWNRGPNPTT